MSSPGSSVPFRHGQAVPRSLLAVLSSFVLCVEAVAAEPEALALAQSCARAIERIETIQCSCLNAMAAESLPTNAVVTDKGEVVLNDFSAAWDKASGRTKVEGRFFTATSGVGLFTSFLGAYDGSSFRTFGKEHNSGQIIDAGPNLAKFRHIPLLLGHGLIEHPMRDVAQLLLSEKSDIRMSPDSSPEKPILELDYLHHEGTENSQPFVLKVEVDPEHGFLPSRIQCFKKDQAVLHTEAIISRFKDVGNGVWAPTRGTLQLFDLSIRVPPGHTFSDVVKMQLSERARIGADYIPAPLGPPEEIIIAESSLKVNERLDEGDLTFQFPENALVYDAFQNQTLQADGAGQLRPRAAAARPNPQSVGGGLGVWLMRVNIAAAAVNIAALLGVLALWARRRRKA
ncbi:MAG: hypothetical protein KF774_11880 [Planctomyces sp.]|nr:hypothetical protein [Planctomyces sp.]